MKIGSSAAAAAALLLFALGPAPAAAYVGPGAGISMIGATIGLVVALLTATGILIRHLVWRPFARRRRGQAIQQAEGGAEPGSE